MAASSSRLGSLHDAFTRYWEHRLEVSELDMSDERWVPFTAADAAVVRAFLKDNNITAEPGGDKDLAKLGERLKQEVGGAVEEAELDAIIKDARAYMGLGDTMQ